MLFPFSGGNIPKTNTFLYVLLTVWKEPFPDLRRQTTMEEEMFKIYEWNFSSTAELAVGALLVLTMVLVAFA